MRGVPKGATDDMVDALTQALKHLCDLGLLFRRDERAALLDESRSIAGRRPRHFIRHNAKRRSAGKHSAPLTTDPVVEDKMAKKMVTCFTRLRKI